MDSNLVLNEMAKTAYTWNGALSYSTTGFDKLGTCLDYWTKAGTYTGRSQSEVDLDMARIFADDESVALGIVFGLRLITRKPNVTGIEEAQTGYGRRDEFYKAVTWMAKNRPILLYSNLHLIPVFGSWKDFFQEPLLDCLDRQKVYALVRDNLGDQLLRKYLPTIRSKRREWSKQTRMEMKTHKAVRPNKGQRVDRALSERDRKRVVWAKGFCKFLGVNYADYRKLKSRGTGHIWQKQMTRGEWDKVHFNGIPGKAMLHATSRKGWDGQTVFERHNQTDRLLEWVLEQKSVKFTGYPYELTRAASSSKNPTLLQTLVYDLQFETCVEPLRAHKLGNVLTAIDTSGSMTCQVMPNVSAYDICISMGLVFSSMNVGYFKDAVVAFDTESRLVKLKGGFSDRLHQIEKMTTAWGSTNFQSVIDLLVRIRQESPEIPVDQYPETLLVISDMQFNPVLTPEGRSAQTNYEAAVAKLRSVGLGDMRIIWWYVNGAGKDFPAQMDDKGVYMIGGFDPNNLKALMGLEVAPTPAATLVEDAPIVEKAKDFVAAEKKEETPLDGLRNWLSQPIFGLLQGMA